MWGLAWKPDPESRGVRVVAFEGKDVEAPVHCSLVLRNVTEPQMNKAVCMTWHDDLACVASLPLLWK